MAWKRTKKHNRHDSSHECANFMSKRVLLVTVERAASHYFYTSQKLYECSLDLTERIIFLIQRRIRIFVYH